MIFFTRKQLCASVVAGASLLLAACNDNDGAASPGSTAISGTAAVGAAIADAPVTVQCGAKAILGITTDANGAYKITVGQLEEAEASLPCVLKVTGPGTTGDLFSIAAAHGLANITPLTTLALARAVNTKFSGEALDAWFMDVKSGTAVQQAAALNIQSELNSAKTALRDALKAAGGGSTTPQFDAFTTAFTVGNSAYDKWLDQYKAALDDAGKTYAQLLASFAAASGSSGFSGITIDVSSLTGTGGTGGGSGTTMTVTVTVSGYTSPATTVTGVPNPGSSFCSGFNAATYLGATGNVTITNCSFSGNTGTISATVSPGQGLPTVAYTAKYVWS